MLPAQYSRRSAVSNHDALSAPSAWTSSTCAPTSFDRRRRAHVDPRGGGQPNPVLTTRWGRLAATPPVTSGPELQFRAPSDSQTRHLEYLCCLKRQTHCTSRCLLREVAKAMRYCAGWRMRTDITAGRNTASGGGLSQPAPTRNAPPGGLEAGTWTMLRSCSSPSPRSLSERPGSQSIAVSPSPERSLHRPTTGPAAMRCPASTSSSGGLGGANVPCSTPSPCSSRLGCLVRLSQGRNWLTRSERMQHWRRGSSARAFRAIWALTPPRPVDNSNAPKSRTCTLPNGYLRTLERNVDTQSLIAFRSGFSDSSKNSWHNVCGKQAAFQPPSSQPKEEAAPPPRRQRARRCWDDALIGLAMDLKRALPGQPRWRTGRQTRRHPHPLLQSRLERAGPRGRDHRAVQPPRSPATQRSAGTAVRLARHRPARRRPPGQPSRLPSDV